MGEVKFTGKNYTKVLSTIPESPGLLTLTGIKEGERFEITKFRAVDKKTNRENMRKKFSEPYKTSNSSIERKTYLEEQIKEKQYDYILIEWSS